MTRGGPISRSEMATMGVSLLGGVAGGLATLMRPSWLLFVPFAGLIGLLAYSDRRRHAVIMAVMLAGLVSDDAALVDSQLPRRGSICPDVAANRREPLRRHQSRRPTARATCRSSASSSPSKSKRTLQPGADLHGPVRRPARPANANTRPSTGHASIPGKCSGLGGEKIRTHVELCAQRRRVSKPLAAADLGR